MGHPFEQELHAAIQAVSTAALVCRSVQGKISPETLEKKDKSPVTIADYAAQAVVSRVLQQTFADDPIIGEEDAGELRLPAQAGFLQAIQAELQGIGLAAADAQICDWIDRCSAKQFSQRFWTLDPIDGTKGFLRKEQYAISLALIVDGNVVVAAVGCPNLSHSEEMSVSAPDDKTGLLYTAVKGHGAEVRSLWHSESGQPVNVSGVEQTSQMRFCESVESGHSSHDHSAQVAERLGISVPPVRLDSQAKYCVVARGEADIYLRLPTRPGYLEKIWDHAGGVLVVQEAGGTVTDVTGKPLDFTHGSELVENRGVVVTNGRCHGEVIAALRAVGVE